MNIPKYRAYHTYRNTYVNVINIDFSKQHINRTKVDYNYYSSHHFLKFDEIVLEPWTGKLDKNKVEIYIGDIVKDKYDHTFEVYWCQMTLSYQLKTKDNISYNLGDVITEKHLEVVGNIHQNKELLQ